MSDWYQQLTWSPVGRVVTRRLGLPRPPRLRRYAPGQALLEGPALLGGAPGARLLPGVGPLLARAGVEVRSEGGPSERWAAIVFDATGITDVSELSGMPAFLAPAFRRLLPSGRLILLGAPPEAALTPAQAAAQRALDGFTRSAAREARLGSTANLLYVAEGAESAIESSLRFFLSGRSAYISGQVIRLGAAQPSPTADWDHPLAGRVAAVTGAARGIGAAVANRIQGTAFQIDITAEDAPTRLAAHLLDRYGGADVLVHNAGITRDRSLVNMTAQEWSAVLAVNLEAQLRITAALLERAVLLEGSRVVSISSTSGIAGNRGQTNYAASKAGIIGMVQALAPTMAGRGMTINAVAPGFIETSMTRAMPLATREIGRRINSLNQGGLPEDVAEAVAWLGQPGSGGINGQVVRVCGQSIVGA